MLTLGDFREVWLLDFEFAALPGERPQPLCLVAREFHSCRQLRVWLQTANKPPCPFDVGPDVLFVAYYSSAEWGCFLALDWPLPVRVLDLFCEFRNLTNGRSVPSGNGLLGALVYHGLPAMEAVEKEEMRALAMRGGEYSAAEQTALLDYCESDVKALERLLNAMLTKIDLPRAIGVRGRYMLAVARMEFCGIPLDLALLTRLREHWQNIQLRLVEAVDPESEVYQGRSFNEQLFEVYLQKHGIAWPRLDSGRLTLDRDTFREMAKAHPTEIGHYHELRTTLAELRLNNLAVGNDGRNRCLLSPFASRTGRNQPSNAKFIFGPSAWLRSLIRPEPGRALAYLDWSQQEFGIAAALSGDPTMKDAYTSGDPYLAFAKQAGAVPPGGTKQTHKLERERYKACILAVNYGMGPHSLANRIGQPLAYAVRLMELHRQTYPHYWEWSAALVDQALLTLESQTVFGWRLQVGAEANARSLANFPCQANGAEMLRIACCLATERGIHVVAPVHDALLIEAAADDIGQVAAATQTAMAEASEVVLKGFRLRTDVKLVRHPDRFQDERGVRMFGTVLGLLESLERDGRNGAFPQRQNGRATTTEWTHPPRQVWSSTPSGLLPPG